MDQDVSRLQRLQDWKEYNLSKQQKRYSGGKKW